MKAFLYTAICLVVLLLAVVVGSQNTQLTDFNYLIAKTQISVSALFGIAILLGALIASCFWIIYILKLKIMFHQHIKKFANPQNKTN